MSTYDARQDQGEMGDFRGSRHSLISTPLRINGNTNLEALHLDKTLRLELSKRGAIDAWEEGRKAHRLPGLMARLLCQA